MKKPTPTAQSVVRHFDGIFFPIFATKPSQSAFRTPIFEAQRFSEQPANHQAKAFLLFCIPPAALQSRLRDLGWRDQKKVHFGTFLQGSSRPAKRLTMITCFFQIAFAALAF